MAVHRGERDMSNEILWYASRATGVVSVVLLTIVVVLGIATAGGRRPNGTASAVVMGMHRRLTVGVVVFLLAHIVTAIAETYVDIGWVSAVVPFTSGYEPVAVGLGALAFDLILAVGISSALRHRMSERTWRAFHTLAHLLWPLAIVHGLALSTSDRAGLRLVTIACGAVGLGAVTWRLLSRDSDEARRREVAIQEWA